MRHAIIEAGEPLIISNARPFVADDGIQHPRSIFTLWTRAEKLAIGVYEVEDEPVAEGFRGIGWTYALDVDHVNATPIVEATLPQPVSLTLEDIAAAALPAATDGQPLTVGRWYPLGATVLEGGVTYEVTQPFMYANAAWTPASLAAHLTAIPAGAEWLAGAAYTVSDEVTYLGTTYVCLQSHTAQAGWEPPNVPALWSAV